MAAAPAIRPPAAPAIRPAPAFDDRARRRPTLEVVGPRRRFRTGPTVALGAVIAFAIAFALVACQVLLVQGQQRLDRVEADVITSTDRYDELRLEVAQLEAPERIVDAATDLGMAPPDTITYLTPGDDGG